MAKNPVPLYVLLFVILAINGALILANSSYFKDDNSVGMIRLASLAFYTAESSLIGAFWALWPSRYWTRLAGLVGFVGWHAFILSLCAPAFPLRSESWEVTLQWHVLVCFIPTLTVGGFFFFLHLCGLKASNIHDPVVEKKTPALQFQFTIGNILEFTSTIAVCLGIIIRPIQQILLSGRSIPGELIIFPIIYTGIFSIITLAILLGLLTQGSPVGRVTVIVTILLFFCLMLSALTSSASPLWFGVLQAGVQISALTVVRKYGVRLWIDIPLPEVVEAGPELPK